MKTMQEINEKLNGRLTNMFDYSINRCADFMTIFIDHAPTQEEIHFLNKNACHFVADIVWMNGTSSVQYRVMPDDLEDLEIVR